jgi:hypothetical protein
LATWLAALAPSLQYALQIFTSYRGAGVLAAAAETTTWNQGNASETDSVYLDVSKVDTVSERQCVASLVPWCVSRCMFPPFGYELLGIMRLQGWRRFLKRATQALPSRSMGETTCR